MSGGGGKGGSQTSEVSLPPWLDAASQRAVQRGEDISKIGYIPYEGADVAALSPQQMAAMQGTQSAAQAFGFDAPSPLTNLPEAQTYAGGIQGYSGAPMAAQLIDDFRAQRPGQAALMDSMFVDPQGGGSVSARGSVGGGGSGGYGGLLGGQQDWREMNQYELQNLRGGR